MRTFRRATLFLLAFFTLGVQAGFAQTNPNLETGIKPFGSYEETTFDSISNTNGNLTLHIPLFGYPQRGDAQAQIKIVYNNKGWSVWDDCISGVCTERWTWKGSFVGFQVDGGMVGINQTWVMYFGNNTHVDTAYTADGSAHPIGSGRSTDATGIYYNGYNGVSGPTSPILLDRRGAGFNSSTTLWNDANGNYVNSYYYTTASTAPGIGVDSLGRTLGAAVTDSSGTTGCSSGPLALTGAQVYGFLAPNGGTRLVKTCLVSVHLNTSFQATNFGSDNIQHSIVERTSTETNVIQSIIVYNGTSWSTSPQWTFEYGSPDPAAVNYGDLTKVTLPTGGTVSYPWTTRAVCDQSAITPVSRAVTARIVDANDGAGPQTYGFSAGSSSDPAGNVTVHTITGLGSSCSLYETQANYYQSGSLLRTVMTDYTWAAEDPLHAFIDKTPGVAYVEPIRVTTKIPISGSSNFLVSKVETDWNTTYGMLLEKREYDYGTNAPGALLRRTTYTYKALSDTNYLNANLLNLVTQVTVKNGSGQIVSQTAYAYDGVALQSSGVTTQHLTTLPNPGYRGNQTVVQNWLNTTSTWLTTRQTTFYDTGLPYLTKDLKLNQTQYTYSPTYAGAYLTQTQSPDTGSVHHIVSGAYDFNTGLLTSFTDQNSQVSNYNYDVLSRMTSASLPGGGSVGFVYTDTVPMQVQKTVAITGSLSKVTKSIFDGLGRDSQSQLLGDPDCQGGSGLVKIDFTYRNDTVQHTHYTTATTPYCNTPGSVFGLPSRTDFDALGRVLKVTQTDGSVVSTSFAQNTTTVTDEVGKQRRSFTDALGRLIEVDEPAGVAPATPGTGSATVTGTLQIIPGTGHPGTGSVTITGIELRFQPDCPGGCGLVYDSGTVSVMVNGLTKQVTYNGSGNTPSQLAGALASLVNADPNYPVNASTNAGTLNLTARQNGTSTNYSLSASTSTNDPTDFGAGSFTATPSGSTLTGGVNGTSDVIDSGTAWVTVNGFQALVNYGSGSTSTTVASAIANILNANGSSPVTASLSGTTMTLTSKLTGVGTNYSLSSGSTTSQPGSFSQPSFTVSPSGSALTGGSNGGQPSLADPAITLYTYDTLDNLLTVTQKGHDSNSANWRPRTFTYDSFSRLLTAANPESGTTTYAYPTTSAGCAANPGAVCTKTSPKPNQTGALTVVATFTYDALNRLTQKSFNDGSTPTVKYAYDAVAPSGCTPAPPALTITNGIGRRTGMCDAAGAEAWAYDVMGRPLTDARTTNNVTKNTSYTYSVGGSLATLTYPSGRVITYAPNAVGRSVSAVDSTGPINYATAAAYAPTGALASLTNGASLVTTLYYNNRLQPCRTSVKKTGNVPSSCTDAVNGDVLDFRYDFSLGAGDNGNVAKIINNRDPNRSQNFTYDALNRIATAYTDGNLWGETFQIDAWGNLNKILPYASKPQAENLNQMAGANNRFTGMSYDTPGNLLNDGLSSYVYNAENQITTGAAVTYTYDGDGKRVKKSNGKLYWYGMGSDALTETDLTGTPSADYVFFNGKRTARLDLPSATVHYYFSDHLGSASIVTSATGTIQDESDYYPFGKERIVTDSDSNLYKFTGKERDSESGLDYFGARFDSSNLGRFMSPDTGAPEIGNPQSWDRYAYVLNNPLSLIDPDGLEPQNPNQITITVGRYIQPHWHEVEDPSAPRFRMFGGANGQTGSAAEADSLIDKPLLWIYENSQFMSVNVTFTTDDKGNVTASIDTPYQPLKPQPYALGPSSGVVRETPSDPNEPIALDFDLAKLTPKELGALQTAAARNKTDPISRELLQAIAEERKRREEEERKLREKEERKKKKKNN
jgi:RHS repeat-associated protein